MLIPDGYYNLNSCEEYECEDDCPLFAAQFLVIVTHERMIDVSDEDVGESARIFFGDVELPHGWRPFLHEQTPDWYHLVDGVLECPHGIEKNRLCTTSCPGKFVEVTE